MLYNMFKYIDPECTMAMNQNVYAKFATELMLYISAVLYFNVNDKT